MLDIEQIKKYENENIRIIFNQEKQEYYVSVVDIVKVVTNSDRPRKYWTDFKQKLIKSECQLSEKIGQLKLKSSDGKRYNTDVCSIEDMIKIIDILPSKNPSKIKNWLLNLKNSNDKETFENIKQIDDFGNECWYARDLMKLLEYTEWRNFEKVIKMAMVACTKSGKNVVDHFVEVNKMIYTGFDTKRKIKDYKLSRYACYLIAQNADSRKEVVALAQTYFALQTRKQELLELDYNSLTEDEKRLYQRSLTRKGNYSLNQTAKKAGVKNFDKFHNAGYKGLYNGETANDIAKRKGLRYREDILDNMGSEELADNLFRIVQTDSKLKRDNVYGEKEANDTHYNMGKDIRNFILNHGGIMPEDLPTPKRSLKEIEKSNQEFLNEIETYEIKK